LIQSEFEMALGLIALAQKGESLSLERVQALGGGNGLPLPKFNLNQDTSVKDWVMASTDEEKYKNIFKDADMDMDGILYRQEAMDLFEKSNMSISVCILARFT